MAGLVRPAAAPSPGSHVALCLSTGSGDARGLSRAGRLVGPRWGGGREDRRSVVAPPWVDRLCLWVGAQLHLELGKGLGLEAPV